jgi:hypothetical protein
VSPIADRDGRRRADVSGPERKLLSSIAYTSLRRCCAAVRRKRLPARPARHLPSAARNLHSIRNDTRERDTVEMIIDRRTPASAGRVDQNDLLETTDAVLRGCTERLESLLPLHADADLRRELSFLLSEIEAARAALTSSYLQS